VKNVILTLGIASALLFAACGKKEEAAAPAAEAAPATPAATEAAPAAVPAEQTQTTEQPKQ